MVRSLLAWAAFGVLVFTAAPAQAQFTKLLDLDVPTTGRLPLGALVSDGTWLYCTATGGGANNDCGTIVRIKLDGSDPTVLHNFDFGPDGCHPMSRLFIQDDYLYGTCKEGGTLGSGTIFRMHMDGTGFQKLLDQTGANGQNALAGLISDGTWLYGTTSYGGQYTFGTVYRIMPDGSGQQLLHEFNGTDGDQPHNELLLVGDTLYGTTSVGGPLSWGTIFKVNKDGTGYTVLHGFGDLPDGRFPETALYAIGDQLYGIANIGGINLSGFIYRIGMDGTGFTKVFEFTPATTGNEVRCSFIYDGTWFYASGNLSDPINQVSGTLFRIKPDGSDFAMLYEMTELDGRAPRDQVLMLGGYLYSAASMGGINGAGTIFRFELLGTGITTQDAPTGWSLYPNPAHSAITLHWDEPGKLGTWEVCDVQGHTVLTRNGSGTTDEQMELSGLADGIYAVVVHDAQGVTTQRFVKY